MENKELRKIYVHFNSNLHDGMPIDDVDIANLMFELVNGRRQRFYEFPRTKSNWQMLINLDNVNCITLEPKK